ncbi:MAG TPA: DUF2298 domain-containing protein [Dehalococcoidia bacterium]|nr:DUF2298 domain-containing protein [Dehalococcoidia bacterium]
MPEGFVWWLTVELIGLAAFPLTVAFFRFLPDRGYAFSKMFGLTLAVYVLWTAGTAHVLPYRRWSIILVFALIALASAAILAARRERVTSFLREHWPYVLTVEALFTLAFAVALYLRSFVPEINFGEKAMDFAFINAVLRTDYFPADDPWLAGHSNPLYYFGHIAVATLTKLTDIPSRITFNLSVALVPALSASMAFGLLYNLLAGSALARRAFAFGGVAVVFLLLLANVEGVFEMLAAHGVGSAGMYKTLDFHGLAGPESSTEWYPTTFWWVGRAVQIGSNWDLREFPFFSYMAGDLHSHIMALPFDLAALAVLLNLWRSDHALDATYWRRQPFSLAVIAVMIGAIAFVNIWDLPTYLFLLVLVAFGHNYVRRGGLDRDALKDGAGFAVPAAALAVVAFLPYYSPAVGGGFPWLTFGFRPEGLGPAPWEAATNWLQVEAVATRPHHFIYAWLPFVWLLLAFFVVALGRSLPKGGRAAVALAPGLGPVLAFAFMILVRRGFGGLGDEITTRGVSWITIAMLVTFIALVALALLRQAEREDGEARSSAMFALAMAGTAFLLLLGVELFWVQEPIGTRFNSLFRTSYQAWILLSLAAAFAAHYVLANWKAERPAPLAALWGWRTVAAVAVVASLVYFVPATYYRANNFPGADKMLGVPLPFSPSPRQSLDGLAQSKLFTPDEDAAIEWLGDAVDGPAVVAEAVGDDYNAEHARVSGRTGLQAVLGWIGHESQWRSIPVQGTGELAERAAAVETLYKTADVEEAKAVLARYGVDYVYVGAVERQKYGDGGLAKFDSFLEVAYRNNSVTVYEVPESLRTLVSAE